jgi:pyruvate,water dikinase
MLNNSIRWFQDIALHDLDLVGGKNASLGEMTQHLSKLGVNVPQGFAITTQAYQEFLSANQLDKKISEALKGLNVEDVEQLGNIGKYIRQLITDATLPDKLQNEISLAYESLLSKMSGNHSVAIRSSAAAEDLPDASFAGQQETYLNISGIDHVLDYVKKVFASLYNDRAIAYRSHHRISAEQTKISVGVQQMVRSDKAASGVIFTIDTESGFDKVIFLTASYGLGELLVQGAVDPDEFYVFKPALESNKPAILSKKLGRKNQKMIYGEHSHMPTIIVDVAKADQICFALNNDEIQYLAKQALLIEKHYQRPMDIEWAKDGMSGELFIVQARPETVSSTTKPHQLERYQLKTKGKLLVEGRSVGNRIGQGQARIVRKISEMNQVLQGDVLVADMTDPDWEPVMKRSAAIVTNRGGRTCHAAIVARELGIPAVVGSSNATEVIQDNQPITVSCAEGDSGFVYDGLLEFERTRLNIETLPPLNVKIMMIVGNPEGAFAAQNLPNCGVGLARLEFIIAQTIGIHPQACLNFESLDSELKNTILDRIYGYDSAKDFYVEKLTEGISKIAAAFWPKPVIVRMSDFKSNEYANLLGGKAFEPVEENPMIGYRGASRYASTQFKECFALECQAVKKVREVMGFHNIEIMIPFVRTPTEAKKVIDELAMNGLVRGENGLRILMMCEIPSNALRADDFLQYFDGFSIGSNDLTQLTLGLDRDSGIVSEQFDERDTAVKTLLEMAIKACKRNGKSVGICGQGPSDHPDLARWLIEQGIDSMSLSPDSVLSTWLYLGK